MKDDFENKVKLVEWWYDHVKWLWVMLNDIWKYKNVLGFKNLEQDKFDLNRGESWFKLKMDSLIWLQSNLGWTESECIFFCKTSLDSNKKGCDLNQVDKGKMVKICILLIRVRHSFNLNQTVKSLHDSNQATTWF